MKMMSATGFATLAAFLLSLSMPLLAQQQIGGPEADREKERLQAVGRAKAQLALTLQVPESQLSLDSATAATWPDSSLGCPEKDRMYAQVVTRGWRVVLKRDGSKHEVHVSGKNAVVCSVPDKNR